MSFSYDKMIRQAALRVSAITGATVAAKESAYTTSPLTSTQIGSVDFPFTAFRDAAISSVAKIMRTYAGIHNHPFRLTNLSQTANIAHKSVLPSVNSTSKPIIGVFGIFRDASSGEILTEQPPQLISTLRTNTDSLLKNTYYHYKIVGDRLWHTVTNAVADVVTFDEATERTNVGTANGQTPLPDACFDIAWCNMVSLLVVDDSFANQAALHSNYVERELNAMKGGAVEFAPAPTLINTAVPSVS